MSGNLIEVRVARREKETQDICSYELVSMDGSPLPPFDAGAHIDVHIRSGLVRQYSLCNAPSERHRYLIGVLRDSASRGGSQAMHDDIKLGALLRISAPKNHFPLVEAPHSLLLAGGIGVTPMLAMAEALSSQGAQFDMHYCARTPEHAAFHDRILASPFASRVQFHFDSVRRLDLAALLETQHRETHIYFCGPSGFIQHVQATATSQQWPATHLHLEYFGTAPASDEENQPFVVKLTSSGATYTVPPEATVLSVLRDAGVHINAACEQGVCGTCLTRVLEGVPEHRDLYLTTSEQATNDIFTPCCSRAKSAMLVLDL